MNFKGVIDSTFREGQQSPLLFDTKKYYFTLKEKDFPHLYLRFSIEDGFRTKIQDILLIYDKIHPDVDTRGLPDTVGTNPSPPKELLKQLANFFGLKQYSLPKKYASKRMENLS